MRVEEIKHTIIVDRKFEFLYRLFLFFKLFLLLKLKYKIRIKIKILEKSIQSIELACLRATYF